MARWLKTWREMLFHNVSVVCRWMPLESKLSDDIALQMTFRCSGLHLATPSIYEWNFGCIFFIMVMNFGLYSLNIWRDSLNKEYVSGSLLPLESLLSDGSKLVLTTGAVLHLYKYLIHSWLLWLTFMNLGSTRHNSSKLDFALVCTRFRVYQWINKRVSVSFVSFVGE